MDAHLKTLLPLLDRWRAAADPDPAYAFSHRHDGGGGGPHLVISGIVHGDEVGSLPALVRIVEELRSGALPHRGAVTLFLGNPEAARANRRFIEDDLNRVFGPPGPATSHEARRARELMPLIDRADVYLDLHQTIEPSERAFYIFPFEPEAARWVRALRAAPAWITRRAGQAFVPGALCADEYARARGVPGITLELGQKGFRPDAAERAERAIREALLLADALAEDPSALSAAAAAAPALEHYVTEFRQPFSDPAMRLRGGLANFSAVAEGEVLSAEGAPPLAAPLTGFVVFPKYPPRDAAGRATDPRPAELYRIVRPLGGDPAVLWAD